MLHHHGQYYDILYPGRIPLSVDLGPGHFGVELFFIISGFVILMTIERKKTLREFAISRTARLMPAFLAALVIATTIRILSPVPVLDTPTVLQFVANLTMAPSLFGQTPMDMPYWTLTYELVFYVGMGLILALGMLRWAEWFGLLAIAVSCLFIATMDVRVHHRTSIVLLVYYSNFFLIGICLYRIHSHMVRPVTWVALVVAIAVTALGGGERSFDAPGHIYLPLAIAFTALVWFAISRHGKWLALRPLVFLGVISYPLYLVHVVLGFAVIRWGVALGWSTIEGVAAAGVVSLIMATLLHYFVEAPGGRWVRNALSRWPAPPNRPAERSSPL
jgi:peptidoglycan/LPS O-acetylase OafA/YrhL